MKEILLEIRYFERGLCQKPSKKLTLFFLLNPVPSNRQKCQKQTGPGISGQVLFRLRNKFTSGLTYKYNAVFELFRKITLANLCQPIHVITNYFTSFALLNLESAERKGKNYINLNISRMKRAFEMK